MSPSPSRMRIKETFWREASRHAPARTVFTTNTSTLAPSALAGFVDRPQQFLASALCDRRVGLEHRRGHGPSRHRPGRVRACARVRRRDRLVPIPIRKEQSGYIINSLLVPWCTRALDCSCAA